MKVFNVRWLMNCVIEFQMSLYGVEKYLNGIVIILFIIFFIKFCSFCFLMNF